MGGMRHYLMRRSWLAVMVLAATLCIKMLVPQGYMIASDYRIFTVSICDDVSGQHDRVSIAVPTKGGSDGERAGKGECAFTALSMGVVGGVDIALLAVAMAFIILLGFGPFGCPELPRIFALRPPLRGPPQAA